MNQGGRVEENGSDARQLLPGFIPHLLAATAHAGATTSAARGAQAPPRQSAPPATSSVKR